MKATPRVLVTGSAGFLGQRVCLALRHHGWHVRAMIHRHASSVASDDCVAADICAPDSLRRAVDGVDAIVHLAARVHVMRETASNPLQAFRTVNVEGTRTLLAAAQEMGTSRFLLISSVKAVAELSVGPLTSRTPPEPRDPYGVSKLEAERLVADIDSTKLRTSILRLPLVYGPGMGGNMLRLFQLVDRGVPLPFGNIPNARSIVYADNVAAAIAHVLALPELPSGPFFVSDGDDVSTTDLVRAIAEALGRPSRLIPMPPAVIKTIRSIASAGTRVGLPDLGPAIDRLLSSLRVDGAEIQAVTGFVPPFTTSEGLQRTATWFRARSLS